MQSFCKTHIEANNRDLTTGETPSCATRIAVVMTSHNRREKTLACLLALEACRSREDIVLQGVLVDDGSTDGTADTVEQRFSWMRVERSDGSLFWCRGMHRAYAMAMTEDCDYYLWLNDDSMVYQDAIQRLLACAQSLRSSGEWPVIVVGSTVDTVSQQLTYGGEKRVSWWRPTTFVKVAPAEFPQRCESMNGNIVLIPADAARILGNLDRRFEHAMGDTDYALRAVDLGVGVWVAPGFYGTCERNSISGSFLDSSLPLRKRLKLMLGRKGLPWRSWLVFTKRHSGPFWPIFFIWPYFRVVISGWRKLY